MSFRWTDEALAAFEERRQKWEATGRVTTHVLRGDPSSRDKPRGRPYRTAIRTGLQLTERQVLRACLNALQVHPKVAFAWRQNVGAFVENARTIRFAFKGCSDILGCLKGGRWLAVECKASGATATENQQAFLDRVNESGGLGICVDDPALLVRALEAA